MDAVSSEQSSNVTNVNVADVSTLSNDYAFITFVNYTIKRTQFYIKMFANNYNHITLMLKHVTLQIIKHIDIFANWSRV